jgi:uncharacterized protein
VTDLAQVLPPDTTSRLITLATEVQAKTGAEIAVLTVDTTAPLDDFTYAMRVVDAWKPGRRREDTGLLVLLVVKDRKVRVLTGYGLEGVLPDGVVGQIQDGEMVPSFRAGHLAVGIERGVRAFAARIAADKGVTLTGVPPRHADGPPPLDWGAILLLVMIIGVLLVVTRLGPRGPRRGRGVFLPGGFGGGGFGGSGGGGFGGFGGGSFGGGGAGRSW